MKVSNNILSSEAMIAAALRAELKVPPMADLEDIAAKLGLKIVEVSSKSFEGALLRSARTLSGRILLHRDIREIGRRRFTIAHEIGHFLLHSDRRIPCSTRVIEGWKEDQPKPEREADSFASELLLPTTDVIERVNNRWPSIKVIVDLADLFGSSLMAAARKFCDVALRHVLWCGQANAELGGFMGLIAFATSSRLAKKLIRTALLIVPSQVKSFRRKWRRSPQRLGLIAIGSKMVRWCQRSVCPCRSIKAVSV